MSDLERLDIDDTSPVVRAAIKGYRAGLKHRQEQILDDVNALKDSLAASNDWSDESVEALQIVRRNIIEEGKE